VKKNNFFWNFLVAEIRLKSSYGKDLGNDTFQRLLFSVLVSCFFFWCVYNFDEVAVSFDQWGHEIFGWQLSDVPSAGKVSWHRTFAAALSGIVILAALVEYLVWLRRRWRIYLAVHPAD
jgi:hypothetical protein